LQPFLCPQICFALFVGRACAFIKADAHCTAAAGTAIGNSQAVSQLRLGRAVERVPAGCQCTHANGDSGRGLSWTLCPVEVLPYLEMHEITFFTSTVTKHNFSEIYADACSIHLNSFRTGYTV